MEIKKSVIGMFVLCLMCFVLCGCGDYIRSENQQKDEKLNQADQRNLQSEIDQRFQQLKAERQERKRVEKQETIKTYVVQNPQLPEDIKNLISNKKIRIGMTTEQVLLSWGKPCPSREDGDCINRTVGAWGVHEQWIYNYPNGPYLYFENGVLASWQD